ncbi:hypothetical protein ACFFWC_08635 [Plantactinospora siamensis]|uniref:Uncharacterized protein n=1 Tax=Plantactinospora siamensis TaxID=555372 RepID=A0ABV6P439_9ACTN
MPTSRRQPATWWAVAVAIAAVLVIGGLAYHRSTTPDAGQVRTAVDNAAYQLERTPVTGLGSYDVTEALYQGNRGGRSGNVAAYLTVTDVGRSGDTRYFEITNHGGDHPVCLAVTVSVQLLDAGPTFPRTSVTDGRCQPPSPSATPSPSRGKPVGSADGRAILGPDGRRGRRPVALTRRPGRRVDARSVPLDRPTRRTASRAAGTALRAARSGRRPDVRQLGRVTWAGVDRWLVVPSPS